MMFLPKLTNKSVGLFDEFFPYWQWEEVTSNMWGSAENKKKALEDAIAFTSDHELYGVWMMKVIEAWPTSCHQHLSKGGDKRSWIGHAACALALKLPEDIVRLAWGHLTPEQQDKANIKAQEAIDTWRQKNGYC